MNVVVQWCDTRTVNTAIKGASYYFVFLHETTSEVDEEN